MKKNKLFLFISILILLILFGTAAICNQCGVTPTTEITTTTETNVTATGEINTTETVSKTTQAQETTEQTIAIEGGTATKPTVNIDRIYGPVKEGDFCVQRFKANITGSPKPAIKWNHDDSNGAFGKDVAQVNLKSGEEFDLKVTVTNSAGSASATVHVKYELPIQPSETTQTVSFTFDPKSGPAGTEVKLNLSASIDSPVETYYNGQKLSWYIYTKTASPDGKTLTETIPIGASSGYFELKYDGKSVKASEQFIVTVPPVSFTFNPKSGPGGTDVKLNLSAPITFSATVYYNGQELPKSVSEDSKTFTVTIPVGAGSGYFKIFYDGKSIQAAEQFTVTAPLTPADLVITDIGPVSTDKTDRIYVMIKNDGSVDLNNADIHVKCQALGINRVDPNNILPAASDEWLKLTLIAGGIGFFKPSMIINVGLFSYQYVICSIVLDGDPTPNNVFTIAIP